MDSETTNQDGVLEIERRSLNEVTIQSYKFKNAGNLYLLAEAMIRKMFYPR